MSLDDPYSQINNPQPTKTEDENNPFFIDDKVLHRASEEALSVLEKIAPQFSPWHSEDRLAGAMSEALGWAVAGLAGKNAGLSEIVKGAVSDIGGQFPGKPGVNPVDGEMSLGEFERRHGKTPNREEPINPLGVPAPVMSVMDEILKVVGNATNARQEAAQAASRVDDLRLDVYRMLGTILEARAVWIKNKSIIAESAENSGELEAATVRFGKRLENVFAGASVVDLSQGDDMETQLFQLKAFCFSFGQHCRRVVEDHAGTPETVSAVEDLGVYLRRASDEIGKIIYAHKDIAQFVREDFRDLNPADGEFHPRGDQQRFDAAEWVSFRNAPVNGIFKDPTFRNFRKTYVKKRQTSYPKLAVDYGNKGPSERDNAEIAHEQIHTNFQTASPAPGVGDKVQYDPKVETPSITGSSGSDSLAGDTGGDDLSKGTCGPMDVSTFEQYKQKLGDRESGGDYAKVNTIGYLGKWQFGGPALVDAGYVKPGTSTRSLKMDDVWTGKDGINKQKDFLDNKDKVQDKLILQHTRRNYKILLDMGVLDKGDEVGKVAGYLMAAHLKGPGGARKLAQGIDNADAYGTKASEYFAMGKSLDGNPSNEATTAVAEAGGDSKLQRAAFVDSTTLPDGKMVSMPPSDTATVRYPYNRPKVYEAGHFKEYDSTPGNERIQERHRTGTGYEIDASGTLKTLVVKDNYTAVMGNDYILVHGHVNIIAKGDVGVKAGGSITLDSGQDLNLNVGGNVNWNVAGDVRENVHGSHNAMVHGDTAMQSGGFIKIGGDGDAQIEAGSVSLVARDGNVNLQATENLFAYALQTAHVLGKAKMLFTSKGNVVGSAGGSIGLGASSEIGMLSGGKTGIKAGSFVTDAGSTSIKSGSQIEVSPKVSHANHAEQADKAAIANPGSASVSKPGLAAATYSYPMKTENDNRQSSVSGETFDKSVKEFNAVKGKSQGHGNGSGSGWDGKGFKSDPAGKISDDGTMTA